jgi:alkaline phosphatase D
MNPTSRALICIGLLACQPKAEQKPDEDTADGLVAATDPGMPDFPSTIEILSIGVRTGSGAFDGTDTNEIDLCLNAEHCFRLNAKDVDDFRVGEIDEYAFEGLNLPRVQVDRVELRSADGSDPWRPSCLELRFDGEPVYCRDDLNEWFGDEPDELSSWVDPEGLHRSCDSCYADPLTHGPMVGSLTTGSANIWVRTTATRPLALRLNEGNSVDLDSVTVAWDYPPASRGFTSTLTAEGLKPDTDYAYGFSVNDQLYTNPTWRFRTPPVPGAPTQVTIALGSCAKLAVQPVFDTLTAINPDLFLFIGDNHYANSDDLDSLRWYYTWSRAIHARRTFLGHTATLATWDDHDFTGNNTDGSAPGKDTALRAFKEYWANPSYGTEETPGVFFRQSWGDVDLFMLDDRYYRGLDDSMLGDEQRNWLKQQLSNSTATFKLLVTGSQWTAEGNSDSWREFPAARESIFQYIVDEAITGVVLLSGDVHRSEFRLIHNELEGGYDLPEFTSSPLANIPSSCPDDTQERLACEAVPSFVQLAIDTAAGTLIGSMVDQTGEVRHEWSIAATELAAED